MFDNENTEIPIEIKKQIAENQQLYHRVFDTEDGKAVLKDLAKRSCDKRTTYPGTDELGLWGINEGRRSLYNYIINLLEKDLAGILESLTKE